MTNLSPQRQKALAQWILATADDQLILAHRDSEWTGFAPILEEDIAIANIAQDELGHATLWYNLLTALEGQDEDYPDRLVFRRPSAEWRNVQLVELSKGDWAFTMLRQYFMDAYETVVLAHLEGSLYPEIAEIAAKIRREELYHLRHSSAWVRRLGLGTNESHRRMQEALTEQWPYLAQLFIRLPEEANALIEAGFIPEMPGVIQAEWEQLVRPALAEARLTVPNQSFDWDNLSRHRHTPYLDELLDDMQQVARLDLRAEW